jgi:hypothetical protein
MSFYRHKYVWVMALFAVVVICSADACPNGFNQVIYGTGSTSNLTAEQKREEERLGTPYFSLGIGGSAPLNRQGRQGTPSIIGPLFTLPPVGDEVVLVAGGGIYNPSAEILTLGGSPSFAATSGPMMTDRAGQTANLITTGSFTGQVLIAGGNSISGTSGFALASAERYNPASGTFTCVGSASPGTLGCPNSMVSARNFQTATTLENGTVLLTAGVDENINILASAEVTILRAIPSPRPPAASRMAFSITPRR